MSELKPCPFCGAEAEHFKEDGYDVEAGNTAGLKHFVWCTECSALVSGDTEQEAYEAWNRRVEAERAET